MKITNIEGVNKLPNNKREELINKILKLRWETTFKTVVNNGKVDIVESLADFIIADRKRIVAPLIRIGSLNPCGAHLPTYECLCQAIEYTLKLTELA